MKRIVLFLATNIAVLVVLSIILKVLGLDKYGYQGASYGQLLAFSAVVAGLSLWFGRQVAPRLGNWNATLLALGLFLVLVAYALSLPPAAAGGAP